MAEVAIWAMMALKIIVNVQNVGVIILIPIMAQFMINIGATIAGGNLNYE
jgi:hypothetical protein